MQCKRLVGTRGLYSGGNLPRADETRISRRIVREASEKLPPGRGRISCTAIGNQSCGCLNGILVSNVLEQLQ
jgi:hypothetical protein